MSSSQKIGGIGEHAVERQGYVVTARARDCRYRPARAPPLNAALKSGSNAARHASSVAGAKMAGKHHATIALEIAAASASRALSS